MWTFPWEVVTVQGSKAPLVGAVGQQGEGYAHPAGEKLRLGISGRIRSQVCLASPRPSGMGGLCWAPCVWSVSQAEFLCAARMLWGRAPSRGTEEAAGTSRSLATQLPREPSPPIGSWAAASAEQSRLHPPSLSG